MGRAWEERSNTQRIYQAMRVVVAAIVGRLVESSFLDNGEMKNDERGQDGKVKGGGGGVVSNYGGKGE
jgi:hypothetical protein